MKCDNGEKAYLGHPILSPACYRDEATREVTIEYNDVEKDVLNLCESCARRIMADARCHHYKVSSKKIK